MSHEVKLVWKGAMQFESTGPGGKVMIAGGTDTIERREGLGPKAMMLSALAGCAGMDIAYLLPKMRLSIEDLDINAVGHLTDKSPQTYDKVELTFCFYGSDLNREKLLKVVDRSVNEMCGVLEMFRKFAEIEVHTEFKSSRD